MALKRREKQVAFGKRIARAAESKAFQKASAKLIKRFGEKRGSVVRELLETGIKARAASNVAQKKKLLAKERRLRKKVERGK